MWALSHNKFWLFEGCEILSLVALDFVLNPPPFKVGLGKNLVGAETSPTYAM